MNKPCTSWCVAAQSGGRHLFEFPLLGVAEKMIFETGVAAKDDARAGRIVRPGGQVLVTDPIPGFLLDMVEAGGLLAQLQQRFKTRSPS